MIVRRGCLSAACDKWADDAISTRNYGNMKLSGVTAVRMVWRLR